MQAGAATHGDNRIELPAPLFLEQDLNTRQNRVQEA
jgi:hypothetical protein